MSKRISALLAAGALLSLMSAPALAHRLLDPPVAGWLNAILEFFS